MPTHARSLFPSAPVCFLRRARRWGRALALCLVAQLAAVASDRGAEPDEPADPALRPELPRAVLERVKDATVFVQVRHVSPLDPDDGVEGSASGFLVSEDGWVVTNWHALTSSRPLAGADGLRLPLRLGSVQVILRSGTPQQEVHEARLLAAHPARDLALLAIEREGVPHLELADSDELVETVRVWALGYPLGRVFSVLHRGPAISVNEGRVSSLRLDDLGALRRIQLDAAVNPGNSGGALILADGRVVGVTDSVVGTTRINFAVPSRAVRALLDELEGRATGPQSRLRVHSERPGATVFLDGERLGATPLDARVQGGHRSLVVVEQGQRLFRRALTVYDGLEVELSPRPLPLATVRVEPQGSPVIAARVPLARAELLREERFDDPSVTAHWRQDTGGTDQRTWYVEGGALHQHSGDGLLHAIFADEEAFDDGSFSARVRIASNDRDGRAGLIFRANEEGFALLRLHRAPARVQLTYHSHEPFGWFVLAERRLPFEIEGDAWYELEVQMLGDQVVGLVSGEVVLETSFELSRGGAPGFYSVDAPASFDDARIRAVRAPPGREAAAAAPMRSFWLREQFHGPAADWLAVDPGGVAAAAPWEVLPGGCIAPPAERGPSLNLLARYLVHDVDMQAVVSSQGGSVGLVLRDDGQSRYVFAVTPATGRLELRFESAGESRLLADRTLPTLRAAASSAAGATALNLHLRAHGRQLSAGIAGSTVLEVEDSGVSHGRIGFFADGARAVFHELVAGRTGATP